MNEEKKYTKLGNLVDSSFTVIAVHGYNWQMWDNEDKRMVKQSEWHEGFTKKWQVETDKGHLDLGTGQMGTLLEECYDVKSGGSAFVGRTFEVKSNGKTGMEIRYFFNLVRDSKPAKQELPLEEVLDDIDDEPVNLEDVPF